jgi:putative two-component system response regulator
MADFEQQRGVHLMSYNILIVDDDPKIREFIRRVLTKEGHRVYSASSGIQAVEMSSRNKFDIVFCDIIMPDESGLETLSKLKALDKDIPVVMISGVGTHDLIMGAIGKGAADFIAKPISIVQLNQTIKKVLIPKADASEEYASPVAHLMREGYLILLNMINNMLEIKHPYMRNHANKVAEYSGKIAAALKLPDEQIEVIYYGAILHDIGKIGINDSISLKNGKLDDAEWLDMKEHPLIGRNMIEEIKLFRAEEPLIYYHHEWYDGSGYPEHLNKDNIPLGARIISVADAYDALISERPYRKAMDSREAQKVIRDSNGIQFDPTISEVFLNLI